MNKTVLLVTPGAPVWGLGLAIKRALESFGLDVVPFDIDAARRAVAPLGPLGPRIMAHVDLPFFNARANRAMFRAATDRRPRLVLILGGDHIRAASLLALKIALPEARIAGIFPDMLFNLRDAMFASLPLYDLYCCHTRAGVPLLKKAGCTNAFYLPFAVEPSQHYPAELTAADRRLYGCDLVYVGNHRTEHAELFRALEGMDLSIWGSKQWLDVPRGTWVRSRWRGRPLLDPVEYAKAHRAAKICLNPIDPLDLPGHNMRTFELPGCRAFALVTRTSEILEMFDEGKTIACFDSPEELVDKVRHYLARPEERERIANASYEHVVNGGHTYRDRMRTLLTAVGLGELAG